MSHCITGERQLHPVLSPSGTTQQTESLILKKGSLRECNIGNKKAFAIYCEAQGCQNLSLKTKETKETAAMATDEEFQSIKFYQIMNN